MDEQNPDTGEDELLLDEPESDIEEFDGEIEDLADEEPDEDIADDDEPAAEEPRPRRRADVAAELEQTRQNNRQIVANQIRGNIPQRAAQLKAQFEHILYKLEPEQQDAYWLQQAQNEATTYLFQIQDGADQEAFRKYLRSKGLSKAHAKEVNDLLAQQRKAGNWGLTREVVSKYVLGHRAVEGGARVAAPGRPGRRAGNGRGKLTRSDMALLSRMRVKDLG